MTLIDREGRLWGRVNLVDALVALFVIGLVPVAYASLLLFRPGRPQIRSIERSEINREERRIANGRVIRIKLKVRGERLTPMLRAFIDDVPAMGFTFESPASADVIVGDDVPMGTHDLILYDGLREVARARGAVPILPAPAAAMRIIGHVIQLDEPTAKSLQPGQRFEVDGRPSAEFLRLGDLEPDRHRIAVGVSGIESVVSGAWRRAVVMRIFCEPDPDVSVCRIGTTTLGDPKLSVIEVPGAKQTLRVLVDVVTPDAPARAATARVRVEGQPELADKVRVGDRDLKGAGADERSASVAEVRRGATRDAFDVVLRLGADRGSDGWRYRSQLLAPGTPFSFTTDRYALAGTLVNLAIDEE